MKFSILTPVLNARARLPGCVASVADQDVRDLEHWVLDGGSQDGTLDWLRAVAPSGIREEGGHVLRWVSRSDRGMYDALNAGLGLAGGEWIAWLNADEQYLEGALVQVARAARCAPHVDIWFGDVLIVDSAGMCLAWRRPAAPGWRSIAATHLYVPSCAMFLHRRLFDRGARFPDGWRIVGDEVLLVNLLRGGAVTGRIRAPLAAFAVTGNNLGLGPAAREEARRLKRSWPVWARAMRWPFRLGVWLRRAVAGGFAPPRVVRYRLYLHDPPVRVSFEVKRPRCRWPISPRRLEI